MESERFDALVRYLTVQPSRRATLGLAFGGALAALPAAWQDSAAKKRKHKKHKKKKKCRGCRVCTKCLKGRCRPIPNFTPCGGVCQQCQDGQCANKPNDSACNEDGKCLDGVCNPKPACVSAGVGGCSVVPHCCSGVCVGDPPTDVCQKGAAETSCRVNADCDSGSCIGFRCAAS